MNLSTSARLPFIYLTVFTLICWTAPRLWAGMDIDLGDTTRATPIQSALLTTSTVIPVPPPAADLTPTPLLSPTTRSVSNATAPYSPTPTVVAIKEEKAVNTPSRSSRATQEPAETPTPIQVIQGVLKAKDIYKAGIKCYQEKEYEKAIAYLQKAVAYDDPYTPKYVIAEAYATLGVIYQFYFPVEGNLKIAADNYKKALRYEPTNPTALKYLRKLKPLSK